jgi:predicted nucleic acid-binding Zn ribbon protein
MSVPSTSRSACLWCGMRLGKWIPKERRWCSEECQKRLHRNLPTTPMPRTKHKRHRFITLTREEATLLRALRLATKYRE